jgi:hypothetical protein
MLQKLPTNNFTVKTRFDTSQVETRAVNENGSVSNHITRPSSQKNQQFKQLISLSIN